MAKKKETAPEKAEVETVEEVTTVKEPVGRAVKEEKVQPVLLSAPRSYERRREEEAALERRNQRQEDAMTIGKYIAAEKRNNMLDGKIAGVEIRGDHAFWMIYDGPVVVMIPFREALPTFMEDEKFPAVRQRQIMTKVIGATIPFTVEKMEAGEGIYYVYGSRRKAIDRISKWYFGETAAQPAKVGDVMTGTFLSVGENAAWLNVDGEDIRIPNTQLSHRYMANLKEYFSVGDQIDLCLQRINTRPKKGDPKYVFSALPCEMEECKTRHRLIRRGNRFVATVTSHQVVNTTDPVTKKAGSYYSAALWLEGIEVPGYATVTNSHARGQAHSGDKVEVEVEDIAMNGYVRCRILSYLPR